MSEFEEALIALTARACDGLGCPVILFKGPTTAERLRAATREFAAQMLSEGAVFLCGTEPPTETQQRNSEAAAWANLALLARATAAAVKEGA